MLAFVHSAVSKNDAIIFKLPFILLVAWNRHYRVFPDNFFNTNNSLFSEGMEKFHMNFIALKYNCIMKYLQRYEQKLTFGLLERGAIMNIETSKTEIDPISTKMITADINTFDTQTGELKIIGKSKIYNIHKTCASIWFGGNNIGFDVIVSIPQKSSKPTLVILYQITSTIAEKKSKDTRAKTKKYETSINNNWNYLNSLHNCIGGVSFITNQRIDKINNKVSNLKKREFIVSIDEFRKYYSPIFESMIPVYSRSDSEEEINKKLENLNFNISKEEMVDDKNYTIPILQKYLSNKKINFTTKMKKSDLIDLIYKFRTKGKEKIEEYEVDPDFEIPSRTLKYNESEFNEDSDNSSNEDSDNRSNDSENSDPDFENTIKQKKNLN